MSNQYIVLTNESLVNLITQFVGSKTPIQLTKDGRFVFPLAISQTADYAPTYLEVLQAEGNTIETIKIQDIREDI